MKKLGKIIALTIITILLSGCREVQFSVEYFPEENTTSDGQTAQTIRSGKQSEEGSFSLSQAIDPEQYFFPLSALPEDVDFDNFDRKMVNVSYLDSNGELLGIAYVRQYQSFRDDLFVAQIIIQSPVPITANLLQSGHYGKDYVPAEEDFELGENALILNKQASIFLSERTVSYRFYKGNTMVIVDLCGTHPFVTEQNVYQLAKLIEQQLPAELPETNSIPSPSLELHSDLFPRYFNSLELVNCDGEQQPASIFSNGNSGICFHADLANVVKDFKVGIYCDRYERLIYQQDFLYSPSLGDWTTGLFYPIWGFGWQNLPEGEYQALFWVENQLVASIPFVFIP
ncbi:MAG TPA: hypothetical protein DCK95_02425 [Anaerolineaceae bacterium]|nr:hypothetical protein [Anaerolineaceae bacterium]